MAFELGKCDQIHVRERILSHLENIDGDLAASVADQLGHELPARANKPKTGKSKFKVSDPLSQYKSNEPSLAGKTVAVLTSPGVSANFLEKLKKAIEKEKAKVAIIAPKPAPFKDDAGNEHTPKDFLAGAPSALFDAVIVAPAKKGEFDNNLQAQDWVRMAYAHLKIIGYTENSNGLLENAGVPKDEDGIYDLTSSKFTEYVSTAKKHRIWERENKFK